MLANDGRAICGASLLATHREFGEHRPIAFTMTYFSRYGANLQALAYILVSRS